MGRGTVWTVEVADISDENRMRGLEFPTFGILGEFQGVTSGEQAAKTAVGICSRVGSIPGVYRVRVAAPDGYSGDETGTWKITVTAVKPAMARVEKIV